MQEALRNCSQQKVEKTECLLMSGSLGSVFNNLSDSQGNSEWLFKKLFPDLQRSFLQCCITCKGSITTLGHRGTFPWHSDKEVNGTSSQGWWVVVRNPGGASETQPVTCWYPQQFVHPHLAWPDIDNGIEKYHKDMLPCQINDKNQEEDLTKKYDRF